MKGEVILSILEARQLVASGVACKAFVKITLTDNENPRNPVKEIKTPIEEGRNPTWVTAARPLGVVFNLGEGCKINDWELKI